MDVMANEFGHEFLSIYRMQLLECHDAGFCIKAIICALNLFYKFTLRCRTSTQYAVPDLSPPARFSIIGTK